jgi:hypothetical protein
MRTLLPGLLLSAMGSVPVHAASLTIAGLVDGADGQSLNVTGRTSVTDAWLVSASAGHGESTLDGDRFSGNSVGASTDVQLGDFFANATFNRWKDSGQLTATTWRGALGWMSASGLSLSALVADRGLDVTYSATVLGQMRQRKVSFDGTGFGAESAWFGEQWTASASFLDYDYGHSVQRVRNILDASDTIRFPRIAQLVGSMATRAASAADQELGLSIGRQFARSSLSGDWQMQRDALTGEKSHSLGLTLGLEWGRRVGLDASAGFTGGNGSGTEPWGGLALTLRTAPGK